MKTFLLFTGTGPLVVLSSHASVEDPVFLNKLDAKGISKFIAHELPLDAVKERYGAHYDIASHDLHETDDLRVIDFDGQRIMRLFKFSEYGPEFMHEPENGE
ncbi:MAG: hypothetical protein QNJ69_14805 [Gammaproteobacteria bacterium]|nr:hypothetical protein [Gammaproteobacteria bacterium]